MPIPQYYCRPCPYPNIIVGHALQLLPLSQGGDEAADVVFSLTAEQNYYFYFVTENELFLQRGRRGTMPTMQSTTKQGGV